MKLHLNFCKGRFYFRRMYIHDYSFVQHQTAYIYICIHSCVNISFLQILWVLIFILTAQLTNVPKGKTSILYLLDLQCLERWSKYPSLECPLPLPHMQASCFHTISLFSNLHLCWYNYKCLSARNILPKLLNLLAKS